MKSKEIKGIDLFDTINEDTDLSVLNIGLNKATLSTLQKRTVGTLLKTHKGIDMTDTGLGKTYDMLAFTQALLPIARENKMKMIMCVGSNKLVEFKSGLTQFTDSTVLVVTGERDKVMYFKNHIDDADIILCTPSAWQKSLEFNIIMYNQAHAGKLLAIMYDEADKVKDAGFLHCIEIGRIIPFALWANATPIGTASTFGTTSKEELRVPFNLLYGCNAPHTSKYSSFRRRYTEEVGKTQQGKSLVTVRTDKLKEDYKDYLVNANRGEIGAETTFSPIKFSRCFATEAQLNAISTKKLSTHDALYSPELGKNTTFKLTPQNVPALSKLITIITTLPPEDNKIIYVHNTKTILILREFLQVMGYNVMVLDGKVTSTPEAKDNMRVLFNKAKGAIALINIIKGSNLGSAKHIIVYDTPSDLFQYIARSVRGFDSKTISFNMIYYPDFEEDAMFNHLNMLKTANSLGDRQSGLIEPFELELKETYPMSERWLEHNVTR